MRIYGFEIACQVFIEVTDENENDKTRLTMFAIVLQNNCGKKMQI